VNIRRRETVMTHNIDHVKSLLDGLSVSAAVGAFFSAIPWPEIAGFLSSVWIVTRLYEYVIDKYKGRNSET
jgi:hypothetical protein